MKNLTVSLIIPALNEEKSLPLVLGEIPKEIFKEVIVVDNGSQDKTAELAAKFGAVVLCESQRGYGRACLTGIDYLKNSPPDVVAFVDADFSDNPKDLLDLYREIQKGADLVIGSRLQAGIDPGAMPPHARFGNWLATTLMAILYPKSFRFSDLGPMRMIRYQALQKIKMCDENFGWTIEMQMKAIQHDLKISEIPVGYKKRIGISKISGSIVGSIKAGVKILYSLYLYYKRPPRKEGARS